MKDMLILATAALKKGQLSNTGHRLHPRVEYVELAKRQGFDFLNYAMYEQIAFGDKLRRLETALRSDITLALVGLQKAREYRAVLAMSERVGIPLAFFKKMGLLKAQLMFRFTAWSARQHWVNKSLGLLSAIDQIIVESSPLGEMLGSEFKVPQEKLCYIPFSIDHQFFQPTSTNTNSNDFIISAGEVRGRDYPTLIEAMKPLKATHLHIAASGSWYAREKDSHLNLEVPDNVSTGDRYTPPEMRELYAKSSIVVIPLYNVVFSAGATVVLEAMAMSKPVIASRSQGLKDYVVDGETGIFVEPGNPQAMREAIEYLLANPQEAKRLGQNGRQRIEQELNLDIYVERLAQLSQTVIDKT